MRREQLIRLLRQPGLVDAVSERVAADELSRFFAPEIALQIRESEKPLEPGQGLIRQAAILNLDLRGFTPLTRELPAQQVMAILAEYQHAVVPVIQEYGGSIDKYMGDGIMATFGAVVATETFAADAMTTQQSLV